MTTAQLALTIAIVGEVCFIAGFLAGTRRARRRFHDYIRRRESHRAIQAAKYASVESPLTSRPSQLSGVPAPDGSYSPQRAEHGRPADR